MARASLRHETVLIGPSIRLSKLATFDAAPKIVTVIVAIFGISVLAFTLLHSRPKPKVPILLQDEVRSSRGRRQAYCYKSRELMGKGYELDMQKDYTYFGGAPDNVVNAIKGKFNASLGSLTPIMHEIVIRNRARIMGEYKDWTPVKVHDRILKLTGHTNARVFHGTAASLSEEWVDASTGYVLSTFDCIRALKAWPPYLRPLVHRFLPERAAINNQWRRARPFIVESLAHKKALKGAFLEEPGSMLDYMSSGKNGSIAYDVEKQLLYQMTLVAVGTVTTYSSIVQVLYDLADHPEYTPMLREEVDAADRDQNGYFTKDAVFEMKKLDSFIKESQRLRAPDMSTFQRAATADITLSDGFFIPKGTKLEIPTAAIQVDEHIYPDAQTFDGLRFYHERQKPGEDNKHLYVSVGHNDLSFGFGRHACPGRYLGHINIKLIVAEVLLNYNIKLGEGQGRPVDREFEAIVSFPLSPFIAQR
ncbi:uncharacterized protein A1O9_01698 [Exophiala aquamarina CBS 119918]|uniref:Cytochrome P450 oxidoreductase n=1 Tax=Exophiala aquamarina CBS 119918 TaxID=1182545 RepID=A0A072Q709_9EURO|nr:uncharacterized protein A1O9_01698 [Exophiala aquamarina CBS 119918]KEF63720.1 hypothetical protein A1O9_01698 [Exophiala aquamarina CBS 119918]